MKPLSPNIPTVFVTGSAGKSTTTAFLSSIFKLRWKVLRTKGNNNLPCHTYKSVKSLNASHQAVVLEIGLGREAGKKHFNYIRPNIGVITNIGTAHYGKLGNSIASIAKYKSVLIKYLQPNGTLLINKDDEKSKLLHTHKLKGKLVTVGIKNKANYQARRIEHLKHGTMFRVNLNGKNETFFIPAFGTHNVINALFAIAISHRLNFSPKQIRKGLGKYKAPARRLNVIRLAQKSVLIDDTFNANPQSVKAALDVLERVGKGKKKIAVLGSMLELGNFSGQGHKGVGRYVARKDVDHLFTFGRRAKKIGQVAIHNGYPARKVHQFKDRQKLHQMLKKHYGPNTVFLVKGSHRMKMDETADFIGGYSLRRSRAS